MSDTEDGSFDKEAEKAKLREQLRREEENRRQTQHMSELLLKGATMTNKHCDTCGDPLFRYEGQEFCPTCSQAEAEGAEAAAAAEGTTTGSTPDGDGDASADPGGIDRIDAGTGIEVADRGRSGTDTGKARPKPTAPGTGGADVDAARASLARTLTRLAQQAEGTDDVGRARELLAAAREAAEALEAVDHLGG